MVCRLSQDHDALEQGCPLTAIKHYATDASQWLLWAEAPFLLASEKGTDLFSVRVVSWVDALEIRNGESIQPLVSDQDDGHTIAANGVIGSAGVLVFLDIVFDEADAVAPEVLAGLLAVAAPGSGIHDDALRCRVLGGREGFVADAFVGVDLERELFGLILVLWLVTEVDAPVLIRPLVDFRRADQRQDGDQGKEESGHAAASMQGRACWLTQERHYSA